MKINAAFGAYRRWMHRNGEGRNGRWAKVLCVGAGALAGVVIAVPLLIATASTLSAAVVLGGCVVAGKIAGKHAAAFMNAEGDADGAILNEDTESHTKILGHKKDVQMVVATDRIIRALTDEYKQAAFLPDDVQRKVGQYILDAIEAVSRVRAYDRADRPLDTFSFMRLTNDVTQGEILQPVTSLPAGTPEYNAEIEVLNFDTDFDAARAFDAALKKKIRVEDIMPAESAEDLTPVPSSLHRKAGL